MLVDAHCHLIGSHLGEASLEEVLARAAQAGVTGCVVAGTDLEDSAGNVALARCHHNIRACVGVHPHEARTWTPDHDAVLLDLGMAHETCFVGETGLDWHYDLSPRETQAEVFRAHVGLAKRLRKPLMVHTRAAQAATLEILQEEGAQDVGGIIHCFSEDANFARQALDLGFHLSFSGLLTFKKADAIREAAKFAPMDRILVETDAPYLAPVPFRGQRNEPAYVLHVAKALAVLRGMDLPTLAEHTTRNLEALCGWRPAC